MINNLDIVKCARTYLGTPWHHVGRLKGIGIDCAGLIVCVANELELNVVDKKNYSRLPDGHTLIEQLKKTLIEINLYAGIDVGKDNPKTCYVDDVCPGDVVSMYFESPDRPCHVGFLSDVGLIHTYTAVGRVVEHRIDETWRKRINSVFRFPGVEIVQSGVPEWV